MDAGDGTQSRLPTVLPIYAFDLFSTQHSLLLDTWYGSSLLASE